VSIHVVLVHPEIHWNTGNAGRTCLATGATLHLIEPLGFSLDEKQVRRAGLDYWERVRPRLWPDWETFEAALPQLGQPFFVSAAGQRDYWDVPLPDDTVAIFGCESVGLPRPLLARFPERTLRIPMRDPGLRSLNLSTAAALIAYEFVRQKRP
jgi:tRNA (cytidine/uridine-2'-O-)-methyltransferase